MDPRREPDPTASGLDIATCCNPDDSPAAIQQYQEDGLNPLRGENDVMLGK